MENTGIKTIWKVVVAYTAELEDLLNDGWYLEKMTALEGEFGVTIVAVLSKIKENE